jgi:hypothetical protein
LASDPWESASVSHSPSKLAIIVAMKNSRGKQKKANSSLELVFSAVDFEELVRAAAQKVAA